MRKIAHIINPVIVAPSSDLFIAQPITFESMKRAKDKSVSQLDVKLFSAQFEEDVSLVPTFFTRTPNLDRSILDLGTFKKPKKLPLIKDILDRLYNNTDAEYLIYTNVDIALQPNFYLEINNLINRGFDAFVINRRTISSKYNDAKDFDNMFKDPGTKHPGYDCFVFKKELYPNFKLDNIAIGTNRIGLSLVTNLISYAKRMKIFKDMYLTFHIGEERIWRNQIYDDYIQFNIKQYLRNVKMIKLDIGVFKWYYNLYKVLRLFDFIKLLKYF